MSTTSYYLYKKQVSYDGSNWFDVQPSVYSYDGDGSMTPVVKSTTDPACGYYPPIYRWVDTEDTICEYIDDSGYLVIESQANNNIITWNATNASYTRTISASTDGGDTWTAYTSSTGGTNLGTLNSGERMYLCGENTEYAILSGSAYNQFASTEQFIVYGDIMALVDGDELTSNAVFASLFSGCTGLTSAENLILSATTLTGWCYSSMFSNCTGLTAAPELPATTLAERCYDSMFNRCYSLTTAPELPATTMVWGCYGWMFNACSGLTTPPELPATTLANACYEWMFANCDSLTTAPVLSATTLERACYNYMFADCDSLTTAPALPATTLAARCYQSMFSFCKNLTVAPVLSASTLTTGCYYWMFYGCERLDGVTCLATDISAEECTKSWLSNVASSGTFTKAASMNDWPRTPSGIPYRWTVQNNS